VVAELQRGDVVAASEAADRLEQMAAQADVASLIVDAQLAKARLLAASDDDAGAIAAFQVAVATIGDDTRPLQVASVRHELAEVLARSGSQADAIAEARAALTCFERLGADPYRDQVSALLRSLGDTGRARPQRAEEVTTTLSAREQEVLELVRHGLTNAEIASRLFISPKTAEHHVGRILTKLGVRSRGEAAALAVRLAAAELQ
jgi:DNA-binding NarL/FixJ family response regulator